MSSYVSSAIRSKELYYVLFCKYRELGLHYIISYQQKIFISYFRQTIFQWILIKWFLNELYFINALWFWSLRNKYHITRNIAVFLFGQVLIFSMMTALNLSWNCLQLCFFCVCQAPKVAAVPEEDLGAQSNKDVSPNTKYRLPNRQKIMFPKQIPSYFDFFDFASISSICIDAKRHPTKIELFSVCNGMWFPRLDLTSVWQVQYYIYIFVVFLVHLSV